MFFRKQVPGLTEASLARFVARAASAAKLHGAVHVMITSNREMRSLNRRFRTKDKPTDVLSFPAEPFPAGNYAGDIAISAEIASRNAGKLGHKPAQEIKILALHGILHLAGYDHENDHGEMACKESQLRQKFRLPEVLTERSVTGIGNRQNGSRMTQRKKRASSARISSGKSRTSGKAQARTKR